MSPLADYHHEIFGESEDGDVFWVTAYDRTVAEAVAMVARWTGAFENGVSVRRVHGRVALTPVGWHFTGDDESDEEFWEVEASC